MRIRASILAVVMVVAPIAHGIRAEEPATVRTSREMLEAITKRGFKCQEITAARGTGIGTVGIGWVVRCDSDEERTYAVTLTPDLDFLVERHYGLEGKPSDT